MSPKNGHQPPPNFVPALRSPRLRGSPFADYIRHSDFKRLLNQIEKAAEQDQLKTLAILSAFPGEGKTFFVAAMALGYAVLLHKRVLIVNTTLTIDDRSLDIRRVFEEQLQYAPVFGQGTESIGRMVDLISPQMNDMEDSGADTVDFLIGDYIRGFQRDYDLILIDTGPLFGPGGKVIDPVVIAGQADAAILITSRPSMSREALNQAKDLLNRARVRVMGAVHNPILDPVVVPGR